MKLRLGILAVVGNAREFTQIYSFNAAHIDSGGGVALWVLAKSEGRAAAGGAEMMLNNVAVEGVGRHIFFGSE